MPKRIFTDFDFQSVSRVTNIPGPQSPGDATNKEYVDTLIEGLAWKDNCRVATQSNINLASPGPTVDGVTMVAGNRVLVRAQSTASQNGIRIWNGPTTPMTRALDASTFAELTQAVTGIDEGTSAGANFRQDQVGGTIDVSDLNWVPFAAAAPAASETTTGVAEIATQAETDAGTDDARFLTPAKLANWAGRVRRFATSIGDGSATSYTVTHNLNSRDVHVTVFNNSTFEEVFTDVAHTTVNTLTIVFATAPASNAFRVVVVG